MVLEKETFEYSGQGRHFGFLYRCNYRKKATDLVVATRFLADCLPNMIVNGNLTLMADNRSVQIK